MKQSTKNPRIPTESLLNVEYWPVNKLDCCGINLSHYFRLTFRDEKQLHHSLERGVNGTSIPVENNDHSSSPSLTHVFSLLNYAGFVVPSISTPSEQLHGPYLSSTSG